MQAEAPLACSCGIWVLGINDRLETNTQFQTVINPNPTFHMNRPVVLHTDTTPPQPNHNVTPTHIEPGMCKLRYTTPEYIQETLSKHTTHKVHSISIRHRSSQYLQKHAF